MNVLLPGGATDMIYSQGHDKKGADGNLLSPSIMINPALWLASDDSNGILERFITQHWDDGAPLKTRRRC